MDRASVLQRCLKGLTICAYARFVLTILATLSWSACACTHADPFAALRDDKR